MKKTIGMLGAGVLAAVFGQASAFADSGFLFVPPEGVNLRLTAEDERLIAQAQEYNKCRIRYEKDTPQEILDELGAKVEEDIADLKRKNVPDRAIAAWVTATTERRFSNWLDKTCGAETKVDWDALNKRSAEIGKEMGEGAVIRFWEKTAPPEPAYLPMK